MAWLCAPVNDSRQPLGSLSGALLRGIWERNSCACLAHQTQQKGTAMALRGMTALYRAIQVSWVNPVQRDLHHTEVWASLVNLKTTSRLVGKPESVPGVVQRWLHENLIPGDLWYYWIRAVDRSGNKSPVFPTTVTSELSATVLGIRDEDLDPSVTQENDMQRRLLEEILIELRRLRELLELQTAHATDGAYAR